MALHKANENCASNHVYSEEKPQCVAFLRSGAYSRVSGVELQAISLALPNRIAMHLTYLATYTVSLFLIIPTFYFTDVHFTQERVCVCVCVCRNNTQVLLCFKCL